MKEGNDMDLKKRAYKLLNDWKGSAYIHGLGVLDQVGEAVATLGRNALVIANTTRKKRDRREGSRFAYGCGSRLR